MSPLVNSGEVHVWRAWCEMTVSEVQALSRHLSRDETERAERFCFGRDRRRFTVARGVLRAILSRYVDIEPGRLRFVYGPHGKPGLAPDCGGDEISFNLSHSGGIVLVAVTRGARVGVDVEQIRDDRIHMTIAERFFSPYELATLRALHEGVQAQAFFDGWTRKEAYLKARGDGLSCPLHRFTVSCAPGAPAALLDVEGDPEEVRRWSLHALIPHVGYASAVAVDSETRRLTCQDWRHR